MLTVSFCTRCVPLRHVRFVASTSRSLHVFFSLTVQSSIYCVHSVRFRLNISILILFRVVQRYHWKLAPQFNLLYIDKYKANSGLSALLIQPAERGCHHILECFTEILVVIIHQIFSLARDWSKRVTWANIPHLNLGNIRGYSPMIFPNF